MAALCRSVWDLVLCELMERGLMNGREAGSIAEDGSPRRRFGRRPVRPSSPLVSSDKCSSDGGGGDRANREVGTPGCGDGWLLLLLLLICFSACGVRDEDRLLFGTGFRAGTADIGVRTGDAGELSFFSDFGAGGPRYDLRLCRSIMLMAHSWRSTGVRLAACKKASLS